MELVVACHVLAVAMLAVSGILWRINSDTSNPKLFSCVDDDQICPVKSDHLSVLDFEL